ncbi:myosin-2 [Clonorchis sinensis]|uniref:Myosin-2 n=1 Tax=Clonorchis sinensis TaxID=79923 RepID=H2KSZ6_CLOSI|nr:myosin-2 [Clonorchis sinensis]
MRCVIWFNRAVANDVTRVLSLYFWIVVTRVNDHWFVAFHRVPTDEHVTPLIPQHRTSEFANWIFFHPGKKFRGLCMLQSGYTRHRQRHRIRMRSANYHDQPVNESQIEQRLLLSNPVLEAFGNARTICNTNSSRFGKFLSLFYNAEQVVVGATVQIYLLEKPRTVFDSRSIFSSFHIFSLLLSSLSVKLAEELRLDDLVSALQQSRECDVSADQRSWSTVLDAFSGIGYSSSDLDQLQNILTSIVLLNTSRFLPASPVRNQAPLNRRVHELATSEDVGDSGSCAVIHPEDLPKGKFNPTTFDTMVLAGRLLGLEEGEVANDFPHQLLTRSVQAGNGSNTFRTRRLTVYTTTCTVAQAKEQRDCLVKTLYNNLFEHIVETINKQLRPPEMDASLTEFGILDLFGFERLTDNGFEQYCINFANERLHQNFMRIAVDSVHNELIAEGLGPPKNSRDSMNIFNRLRDCDNTPVIDGMKLGAGLLDEVCLLNRIQEISSKHRGSAAIDDPRDMEWMRRLQMAFSSSRIIIPGLNTVPSSVFREAILQLHQRRVFPLWKALMEAVFRILRITSNVPGLYGTTAVQIRSLLGFATVSKNTPSPRPIKKLQTDKNTLVSGSHKLDSPSQQRRSVECFTVRHFAGPVVYSIHGFVSKNLDRIPTHLLRWMMDSVVTEKSTSGGSIPSDSNSELPLLHAVLINAARTETTDIPACASPRLVRSPLRMLNPSDTCISSVSSPSSRGLFKEPLAPASPVTRERVFGSPGRANSRRINTVFGNFKSGRQTVHRDLATFFEECVVQTIRPGVLSRWMNDFSHWFLLFTCAVDSLLVRLENHQLSFVRCLRPNLLDSCQFTPACVGTVASPATRPASLCVDRDRLHDQLVTGGLLTAVHVLRSSYSRRYTYVEFIQKYGVFRKLSPNSQEGKSSYGISNSLPRWFLRLTTSLFQSQRSNLDVLHGDSERCEALFLLILALGTVSDATIRQLYHAGGLAPDVRRELHCLLRQFGHTRLHLKPDQADRLENLSGLIRRTAASIIQRSYRRYRTRVSAARTIQIWWRSAQHAKKRTKVSTIPVSPLRPAVGTTVNEVLPVGDVALSEPTSSSLEFATHQPYLISRRSLRSVCSLASSTNCHFWNKRRFTQLHCLLPFVWRPASPELFSHRVRGLTDALS